MIVHTWKKIVHAGIDREQSLMFSDKLQNCNRLSLFCALFSIVYFFYFLQNGLYLPFSAITLGITIFIAAIVLNHKKKYGLSSILLLFNTNFCVFFFSIYLGFDSGIHLYLFTSPLIVLSLFHAKSKQFIYPAMLSYLLNFSSILVIEKYFKFSVIQLDRSVLSFFYLVNFIFAISILISLSMYFLLNNEKINYLLIAKNEELNIENLIRKKAEELAKTALHEREILLSEIHHRVKNNLAIISALINLQIENLKDVESKIIFEETKDRIYSMALIHNQLYQNKSFAQIEFAQYINNFCSYLVKSYQTIPTIEIIEDTENIMLDIKTAIPCALILNELITNSFKHAFKNQATGKIEVGLKKEKDKTLFWVADTGSGMDKAQLQASSMGMSLITSLVEQIEGKLEYSNTNGSKFTIRF
jgi:two-component sensor histidine kinase